MVNEDRRTNIETTKTSKVIKESHRYSKKSKETKKKLLQTSMTTHLDEVNQKIKAKESRLKRDWDRVKENKQDKNITK